MTADPAVATVAFVTEPAPRSRATLQPPADTRRDDRREPLRTCPNCGRPLTGRACKLVCPDPACGFFLSCSDYL